MSDTVLKLRSVSKRFGKKVVLDNISLDIKSGEIFGIIGLSGSGKTTMLNTMIGFLEPSMGDVLFRLEHLLQAGDEDSQFQSVFSNPMEVKKTFGFASQAPSFYQQLTCIENLDYFGKLYDLSKHIRRTNADILLKLMGINESRDLQSANLSGGMQKRLDIACALIHDPKVLILDEPTADLDPILRKQMWSLINSINEKGTTIVLSSHFLDELEVLCDRVCILYNGQIIITGTPDEVKAYYSKEEEIRLETAPGKYQAIIEKLQKKSKELRITKMQIDANKLVIYTTMAEKSLHEILHMLERMDEILIDVTVEKPSLQEVLENMVKEGIGK